MNRLTGASIVVTAALLVGCGKGSDTKTAAADKDKPTVGRCAVDVKDGAPYGKITSETTEAGERMFRIEDKAATWNKNAKGVRVVDC
ncbi:MAG: hypothetical protein JWO70_2487 [Betaproteobacteria bacterium]|jgi:hypothetical protein|nr:hypothetical protein [Betaproteobacteria bacterium]